MRNEAGERIGAYQFVTDISERMRSEGLLAEAQEQLRQSQKLEAIGQLTGGVAHDFYNLLTVIRGSVDLLRRDNLSQDKRARYIDAIGDTADRSARLLERHDLYAVTPVAGSVEPYLARGKATMRYVRLPLHGPPRPPLAWQPA